MEFNPETSEYRYLQFITAIKEERWTDLLDHCQNTWIRRYYPETNPLKKLIDLFGRWKIIEIVFIKRAHTEKKEKLNPDVINDIISLIVLDVNGTKFKKRLKTRVIKEDDNGSPDKNGRWGVNPISALKVIGWR